MTSNLFKKLNTRIAGRRYRHVWHGNCGERHFGMFRRVYPPGEQPLVNGRRVGSPDPDYSSFVILGDEDNHNEGWFQTDCSDYTHGFRLL